MDRLGIRQLIVSRLHLVRISRRNQCLVHLGETHRSCDLSRSCCRMEIRESLEKLINVEVHGGEPNGRIVCEYG